MVNEESVPAISRGTSPADPQTQRPSKKLLITPFSHNSFPSSSAHSTPDKAAAPLQHNNVPSGPQDAEHSTGSSDVSWVAEAEDEEGVSGGRASDESWIAEDVGEAGTSTSHPPLSRPISISLAKKELSQMVDQGTPSPSHNIMSEGKPGIAESSSFLLTPGAEMTVQYCANPAFAEKPTEAASPPNAVAPVANHHHSEAARQEVVSGWRGVWKAESDRIPCRVPSQLQKALVPSLPTHRKSTAPLMPTEMAQREAHLWPGKGILHLFL